jgi:hypothetical protein
MILEQLIDEYIAIPHKTRNGWRFILDLSKDDGVASDVRYLYMKELCFYIARSISKENNLNSLQQLINKYGKILFEDKERGLCLYKRSLVLDPTNVSYYKKLAEAIVLHMNECVWEDAQKMVAFAEQHNWQAATELLNSLSHSWI